ncbi:3-oxoacyl-ACP synthase [Mangrovibacterium marinum]|uniref:Transcription elongation GreA/GreB family factor n=1 Tax=Mangrovibacterium marinum TaxID=1639118 RepID=A0A2T5BZ86_9BACT|nr:3-oxoacyl-ACP synthase [Mangrovibacterium marinum]PTN07584.1 transcription elongation GreA/GreB family factor [Mangrovibacterium marinum]
MNTAKMKARLIAHLDALLDQRVAALEQSIQSAKESRDSDTKSSAGDKYETGREMIQQEVDKFEGQLAHTRQLKVDLGKINPEKRNRQAEFGSLLICNPGNYFLSIAVGKVEIDSDNFICLSLASPLGKAFYGKTVGDELLFNGKKIVVEEIY